MKNMMTIATLMVAALFVANCKTIDKAKIAGGKESIVVNYHPRMSPFGLFSATAEDCLEELNKEGAQKVNVLYGQSKNSAFRPLSASISNQEACYAIGTK